jgi:hypothetical protein
LRFDFTFEGQQYLLVQVHGIRCCHKTHHKFELPSPFRLLPAQLVSFYPASNRSSLH